MTESPGDASAIDFQDMGVERAATRFLDGGDVLFECTHGRAADSGGITIGYDEVRLGGQAGIVRIKASDVVGWSMGEPAEFTVLAIWSTRPPQLDATTVPRRFAAMTATALTQLFGAEHEPGDGRPDAVAA